MEGAARLTVSWRVGGDLARSRQDLLKQPRLAFRMTGWLNMAPPAAPHDSALRGHVLRPRAAESVEVDDQRGARKRRKCGQILALTAFGSLLPPPQLLWGGEGRPREGGRRRRGRFHKYSQLRKPSAPSTPPYSLYLDDMVCAPVFSLPLSTPFLASCRGEILMLLKVKRVGGGFLMIFFDFILSLSLSLSLSLRRLTTTAGARRR
jgi:hypothetical protein